MNRKALIGIVFVAVVLIGCYIMISCDNVYSAQSLENGLTEETIRVYRKQVKRLEKLYGKYSEHDCSYDIPDEGWKQAKGLCYLKLIDFNKDGVKDLFAVWYRKDGDKVDYEPYDFAVFTAQNGKCVKLGQYQVGDDSMPVIYWFGVGEYESMPCVITSERLSWIAYGVRDGKLVQLFDSIESSKDSKYIDELRSNMEKRLNLDGDTKKTEWSFSGRWKKGFEKSIKNTKKILRMD